MTLQGAKLALSFRADGSCTERDAPRRGARHRGRRWMGGGRFRPVGARIRAFVRRRSNALEIHPRRG